MTVRTRVVLCLIGASYACASVLLILVECGASLLNPARTEPSFSVVVLVVGLLLAALVLFAVSEWWPSRPTDPALPRVVCAWCGVVTREGPAFPVSHGICPACAKQAFRL